MVDGLRQKKAPVLMATEAEPKPKALGKGFASSMSEHVVIV